MSSGMFHFDRRFTCRICEGELETLWDLGSLALTGHFPGPNEDVPSAPMEVAHCLRCSLVQLAHNYTMPTFFGTGYGYRSGLNRSMVAHLTDLAQSTESLIGLKDGDLVVDVGGNDGTTLSAYRTKIRKVIVDPTARNWVAHIPEDIHVIPDFFEGRDQLGGEKAKLITTISMLYDLPDPRGFIGNVYDSLEDDGFWLCEQSDLAMMLEANSFDTICHEHLEYYSEGLLIALAKSLGFTLVSNTENAANGGSRRLLFKKATNHDDSDFRKLATKCEEQSKAFDRLITRTKDLEERLKKMLEGTKYHGLGASTKGNTLLQVLRIEQDLLPYVAEVNPAKFGKFTPGTRIPIISEDESRDLRPEGYLVLPWHFREHFLLKKDSNSSLLFPLPNLEKILD